MTAFCILAFTSPVKSKYFTHIAQHAEKLGVTVYHLTPKNLTLTSVDSVTGYKYECGTWVPTTFSLPNYVYDQCYYATKRTKAYKARVKWLKEKRKITFIGNGLPNKWEVFQAAMKVSTLQPYFPFTTKATEDTIFSSLKQFKTILLKPVDGLQGNGIIKLHDSFLHIRATVVNNGDEITKDFMTHEALLAWIFQEKKEYIIQPFLLLQDELNHPFDLRILLQKNENGKWEERKRVIRKGKQHTFTSNIGSGGSVIAYEDWRLDISPFFEQSIQEIIHQLPLCIEKQFLPLFELGIDIGISPDYCPYILDINSKPGHKIMETSTEEQKEKVYEAPTKYVLYLDQLKEWRKNR